VAISSLAGAQAPEGPVSGGALGRDPALAASAGAIPLGQAAAQPTPTRAAALQRDTTPTVPTAVASRGRRLPDPAASGLSRWATRETGASRAGIGRQPVEGDAPTAEAASPGKAPKVTGPPARRGLPSPASVAGGIAMALLEVEAGCRSALQLERVCAPELWDRLEQRVRRQGAPFPAAQALMSVHCQEHVPGVANAVAVVRRGGRVQPVAMRLDAEGGRWVVTVLQY